MKLSEIRSKPDAELQETVERLRREAYHLRVQAVTGTVENPARSRTARREVARILTILGERARKIPSPSKKGAHS